MSKVVYENYFTAEPCEDWDILKYIDRCIKRNKSLESKFNYNAALNLWLKHLRITATNGTHDASSRRAQQLLASFHKKGCTSDKSRAKRYYNLLQNPKRPTKPCLNPNRRSVGTGFGNLHSGKETNAEDHSERRSGRGANNTGFNDIDVDNDTDSITSSLSLVDFAELDKTTKISCANGRYVEDILANYAKGISGFDLSHWSIIDTSDVELITILRRNGWDRVQASYSCQQPMFPAYLSEHFTSYLDLRDVTACRSRAYASDEETLRLHPTKDQLFLKRWIDRCCEHMISLLTESHDLLLQPLSEGVWTGVYWTILDLPFINIPDLWLQRRDIELRALRDEVDPVVSTAYRFDGVVRTRKLPKFLSVLEFGVIEVSRNFQDETSSDLTNDLVKLYAGCRSILNKLKAVVHNDVPTVKKLAAVGILQTGPYIMVVIMRCLGENLFSLKRGGRWKLPTRVAEFPTLQNVVAAIWIARAVIHDTYRAVMEYLAQHPDIPNSIAPSGPILGDF